MEEFIVQGALLVVVLVIGMASIVGAMVATKIVFDWNAVAGIALGLVFAIIVGAFLVWAVNDEKDSCHDRGLVAEYNYTRDGSYWKP